MFHQNWPKRYQPLCEIHLANQDESTVYSTPIMTRWQHLSLRRNKPCDGTTVKTLPQKVIIKTIRTEKGGNVKPLSLKSSRLRKTIWKVNFTTFRFACYLQNFCLLHVSLYKQGGPINVQKVTPFFPVLFRFSSPYFCWKCLQLLCSSLSLSRLSESLQMIYTKHWIYDIFWSWIFR